MVNSAGRSLLSLILPRPCAGCGAAEPASDRLALCGDCADDLAGSAWPGGPQWTPPVPAPPGCPAVVSAAPFDGVAAALVSAYKDGGRRDVRPTLATLLASALAVAVAAAAEGGRAGPTPVVLVPVPSSAASRRRRGDQPLQGLVRAAAGGAPGGIRVVGALRQRRSVRDQSGLSAQERALNLAGSMGTTRRGADSVRGASCVVVDDVVTTGATLVEAARALRAAGAHQVLAATVCATQRRNRPVGQRIGAIG